MTAVCQICNEGIVSREVIPRPGDEPGAVELQNFDILAAFVLAHITARHERQAREAMAVANLAAKVYAMTHAESMDLHYSDLRGSWSSAILKELTKTYAPAPAANPLGATEAPGTSSTPAAPPSGS